MNPKPYRILHFVQIFYSIIGWLGLVASFLVCGLMWLISIGADNRPSAVLLAAMTAIGIGLSTFIASIAALTVSSLIGILLDIQARVYRLPLSVPTPDVPAPSNPPSQTINQAKT